MKMIWDNWFVWALLSATFAALTAVFGKIGVQRVDADFATMIRVVVILVFVVALVSFRNAAPLLTSLSGKTYTFLALSGLATGASWLCYYRALKIGQASQVAPIDKLSVVLVALFGVFVLNETVTLKNWLGIGLIAGGALMVASKG